MNLYIKFLLFKIIMSEDKKMKKTIKAEKPGGFLDFLPMEYLAREKMLKNIEGVFRSFGFDPIETPRIEFLKTLAGEESDTGKNIFHIKSSQDSEPLAMPFDHTVPFARLLASNPYNAKLKSGIRLPWKRMVVGPVFRGESPQSGRYRQFYQFDADIAGTSSMVADAEIIAMMYETMKSLGVEKFVIKLNNRKILNGLAFLAGIQGRRKVDSADIVREMMRSLDKLDKIGIQGVVEELGRQPESEFDSAPALSNTAIEKVKKFLDISGDNMQKISQCREIFAGVPIAQEGIDELNQINEYLKSLNIPEEFVVVDFSIARGLDYYTGPVMETILLDAPQFGSVFSGGRYNDLVSRFTNNEMPAVGASIGVDRLFTAMSFLGVINKSQQTVSEVMVLRLVPGMDGEYLKIAKEIRLSGMNTEVCLLEDMTFKKQFNFAISRGVKYVVIVGSDEFAKNTVQVKNLDIKVQEEMSRDDIGGYFLK